MQHLRRSGTKVTIKPFGRFRQAVTRVAAGHQPASAIPRTAVPAILPLTIGTVVWVVHARGRERIVGPELTWIQEVFFDSGEVAFLGNVRSERIEPESRFIG